MLLPQARAGQAPPACTISLSAGVRQDLRCAPMCLWQRARASPHTEHWLCGRHRAQAAGSGRRAARGHLRTRVGARSAHGLQGRHSGAGSGRPCAARSAVFKGPLGGEAVLCTNDKTYAVKTVETTSLLLVSGAEVRHGPCGARLPLVCAAHARCRAGAAHARRRHEAGSCRDSGRAPRAGAGTAAPRQPGRGAAGVCQSLAARRSVRQRPLSRPA